MFISSGGRGAGRTKIFEPNPPRFTGFGWYMLSSLLQRQVARIIAKELSFPTVYCFPSGEFYEPVRNGENKCCRFYNRVCVFTTRTCSRLVEKAKMSLNYQWWGGR